MPPATLTIDGTSEPKYVYDCLMDYLYYEIITFYLEKEKGDIETALFKIETIGYRVGSHLIDILSVDQPKMLDALDVMKFVCKEVWFTLFKKQIDNLKTNHRGVFVLQDSNMRWLSRLSNESNSDTSRNIKLLTAFPCGILKGVLSNLGFPCNVNAESTSIPACSFQTKAKKTRKFAQVKRIINPNDTRLKSAKEKVLKKKEEEEKALVRQLPQTASSLFFHYNTDLGPPYHIIVDTNFINFSIQNKLDLVTAMMDCLYAKCIPCITDCIMAELEKLGPKFRVALRIARDPRFERLPCTHSGTYADDCIVQRVMQHKCYIVATCDRGLKKRIRKIPGVPIMYIAGKKYCIEQLPESFGLRVE